MEGIGSKKGNSQVNAGGVNSEKQPIQEASQNGKLDPRDS